MGISLWWGRNVEIYGKNAIDKAMKTKGFTIDSETGMVPLLSERLNLRIS